MDNFTQQIKEVLDKPITDEHIDAAAMLLLRLNRNRILYQYIIRRRDTEKLKYELQKMYNFRIIEQAERVTQQLEQKAEVIIKETLTPSEKKNKEQPLGKRTDHDSLPDSIKALYLQNLSIIQRMRKLHEQLKLLNNARPCDRYEFLRELVTLDKQLRANYNAYDTYNLANNIPPQPLPTSTTQDNTPPDINTSTNNHNTPQEQTAAAAKKISAARKYISENKTKLAQLRDTQQTEAYRALLAKVQQRIDILTAQGAGISQEQLTELIKLGCHA
jgi:hypothetical protein